MTVGELKKLLEPIDDELPVIVAAPFEEGHDETLFQVHAVEAMVDQDTEEEYCELECTRLDFGS
jgi:hypothetical protein